MKRAEYVATTLLFIFTVCLCLVAGELVIRAIDGYRIDRLALVPREQQQAGPAALSLSYAKNARIDPSFNLAWYRTNPRDYDRSNKYPLPRDWVRAVANYKPAPGERPFVKEEFKFLYNEQWLERACKTGEQTNVIKFYARNPGFVYAFASPDGSVDPQYRIVPRGWTEGDDYYNNFGFRGPDITPRKSARTIRIAFLGASATAQGWPFTYPEYAVHFLRLWAKANHFDVDFDVINAGRSGLDSSGISRILRYEVAPLHPDIVVYDGTTNDFIMRPYVKQAGSSTPAPAATSSIRTSVQDTTMPLEGYSALLGRVYQLLFRRGGATGEPPKPEHALTFDFAQKNPDLSAPDLPFRLSGQVADLQQIAETSKSIGARLFVSSFVALPHQGLRLDPERDRIIIGELNSDYWPLTYGEIREGLDFQNNAYRELAEKGNYGYLDVSKYFPEDPELFSDMVHFRTSSGERLQGWIVAQLLAAQIGDAITKRELPKPAYDPDPSALAWATAPPIKFGLSCLLHKEAASQ